MDDRNTYDQFQNILPDVLPIIARFAIDRGSVFKAFRETSRLFRDVAVKVCPDGDEVFADHYKTIVKKYNIVPKLADSMILDLPEITPAHIFTDKFQWDVLPHTNRYDFDDMVLKLTPFCMKNPKMMDYIKLFRPNLTDDEIRAGYQKIDKEYSPFNVYHIKTGIWLLERLFGNYFNTSSSSKLLDILWNDLNLNVKFREKAVPLKVVQYNPQYPWNFGYLSSNPNITKGFYLAHKNKNWNRRRLLYRLNFEFASSIALPGDICLLLSRSDVTWDFLEKNIKLLGGYLPLLIKFWPPCVGSNTDRINMVLTWLEQYSIRFRFREITFPRVSWKILDHINIDWTSYNETWFGYELT